MTRAVGRVLVAPDKFKGSLTAGEVAEIVADALTGAGIETVTRPIADGGEGTVDVAVAHGFEPVTAEVAGPLGVPVRARYAVLDDVAVIEMSAAAGLGALGRDPNPQTAASSTTRGVGELVAHALDRGARRIALGVGGSASTDGGGGLVQALGGRLLDDAGAEIEAGGVALEGVAELDLDGVDPRLRAVDLVVACDVDNPLCGEHGAAAVYGPQKGADADLVERLGAALAHWADVVAAATGTDRRDEPGTGAGGGIAFGAVTVLGGRIESGVDVLADLTGLDTELRACDLLIVGEGSLDEQSLHGKGPIALARRARELGRPVVAVAGRNQLSAEQSESAGLQRVYALTDLESSAEACLRDARRLLTDLAHHLAVDLRL